MVNQICAHVSLCESDDGHDDGHEDDNVHDDCHANDDNGHDNDDNGNNYNCVQTLRCVSARDKQLEQLKVQKFLAFDFLSFQNSFHSR